MSLEFQIEATEGRARAGRLLTAHGEALTPVFMPVGTRGSVKGVLPRDLAETGASILLANTYHLMLRPGVETVRRCGGLSSFMRWPGPTLTDSGGFQVFSLADRARIDEGGVSFQSTYDGARLRLGPVESMTAQRAIGADIVMAFDHCASLPATRDQLGVAVARTTRWAATCRDQPLDSHQSLFGIVQGGDDLELRAESAAALVELDLPGYAIGGLSVGEDQPTFERVCQGTAPLLPADRPRYLMGVGTPRDLIVSIAAGIDMFDCVLPTRNGRNAQAYTPAGIVRLRASAAADEDFPIEEGCPCYSCAGGFTRAYVRHLFKTGEMLGPILVSIHNLSYYHRLMRLARQAILSGGGSLERLTDQMLDAYPARPTVG